MCLHILLLRCRRYFIFEFCRTVYDEIRVLLITACEIMIFGCSFLSAFYLQDIGRNSLQCCSDSECRVQFLVDFDIRQNTH